MFSSTLPRGVPIAGPLNALERHGIAYTEVNIESTPGAAEEVIRRTGKRAIPQFVINGEWVQPYRPGEGFLYEEMSELLGISCS